MKSLKDGFNLMAVVLGGAGSFLFSIATVTEFIGGTPGAGEVNLTVPCALAFAASAGVLYAGIRGFKKAGAEEAQKQKSNDQSGPTPPGV